MSSAWIFVADGATMPSAVFEDQDSAKDWIKKYSLSGVLTEYPIDICIYDWAIGRGLFEVKYPSQRTPSFIGRFTSAYLKHGHFENGEEMT